MYQVLQCDGTTRVYEYRPWWVNEKPETHRYRERDQHVRKATKIQGCMLEVLKLRNGK